MQGIQGSGKSTWAKNWVAEDPTHRVRWNNDDLRNMFGPYWVPEREKTHVLDSIKYTFISKYIEAGYDIVIDDMNLNPTTVTIINQIVEECNNKFKTNYTVEKHFMATSIEDCIERDSRRTNPIGKDVIQNTYKKYRSYIAAESTKQYLATRDNVRYNPDLPDCVLVDLDGVMAFNVSGRSFWGKEAAKYIKDDAYDPCMVNLVNLLSETKCNIIFLTGRPNADGIKEATIRWLDSLVAEYTLLMRKENDYSPAPECKKNLYNEYIKNKFNVLAVFEDQTKNVKMWRDLGILCLQTNEGNL